MATNFVYDISRLQLKYEVVQNACDKLEFPNHT